MKFDDKARAYIGIGIVFVFLGVLRISDQSGPPGGKWSLLWKTVYEHFGAVGVGLFSIGVGVLLMYVGYSRRKE